MQIRKTKFKSVFQSDAKTKHEKRNSNPFLKVMRKRKTKTEIQIPFSKCGENEKRKTRNENQIRFSMSQVDKKRKIEMGMKFHFTRPKKNKK